MKTLKAVAVMLLGMALAAPVGAQVRVPRIYAEPCETITCTSARTRAWARESEDRARARETRRRIEEARREAERARQAA